MGVRSLGRRRGRNPRGAGSQGPPVTWERPPRRVNPRLRDDPGQQRRVLLPRHRRPTSCEPRVPAAEPGFASARPRPRPGSPLPPARAFSTRQCLTGLSSAPASSWCMQTAAASRATAQADRVPSSSQRRDTGPRAHSCPGVPGAPAAELRPLAAGRNRCRAGHRTVQHVPASRSQTPASLAGCPGCPWASHWLCITLPAGVRSDH